MAEVLLVHSDTLKCNAFHILRERHRIHLTLSDENIIEKKFETICQLITTFEILRSSVGAPQSPGNE